MLELALPCGGALSAMSKLDYFKALIIEVSQPQLGIMPSTNRETAPRPGKLGRKAVDFAIGIGNGTRRQQDNLPVQGWYGNYGWG